MRCRPIQVPVEDYLPKVENYTERICEYMPEIRTRKVPVTVCRKVEEVVTERVPCTVAVQVPYQVTIRVPVPCCVR